MKEIPQLGCAISAFRIMFGYVLPGMFTIAGAVLMIVGARNIQGAWESENWPHVDGTIIESKVGLHTSRSSNGRSSTSYSVDVGYSYTVEGKEFTGDRLRFGEMNSNKRRDANSKAKKFGEGKQVKVYYDPEEPAESVLEPGVHGSSWFLPIFGTVFFTVGTLLSIFLPRMFRRITKQLSTVLESQEFPPNKPAT